MEKNYPPARKKYPLDSIENKYLSDWHQLYGCKSLATSPYPLNDTIKR